MKKADRLNKLEMSKIRMTSKKMDAIEASGKKIIRFTYGEPNFNTPEYIKEAAKKAIDENHTKYTDYTGTPAFQQAVVDKYERETGLKFKPGQVISTHGGAQAAYLVLTTFLNPGDEVIIPNPMYNIYRIIGEICGATVKQYSLKEENQFQIDLKEMENLITDKTKMIVICSPSNPIGSVLTDENLKGLGELVKDKDLLICSDEMYATLVYDGVKASSPAKFDTMRDKTIIINGFSKEFAMTGWRIGYVITPEEFFEPLYLHTGHQVSGMADFIIEACTVALNEAPQRGETEKMRAEFDERRKYLVKEINTMKHFSCLNPVGAFYIFMNIKKTGMTSDEFCDWIVENYGVAMITGSCFGTEGEGFVRISYASSMEDCKAAMEILHKADADLTAQGK